MYSYKRTNIKIHYDSKMWNLQCVEFHVTNRKLRFWDREANNDYEYRSLKIYIHCKFCPDRQSTIRHWWVLINFLGGNDLNACLQAPRIKIFLKIRAFLFYCHFSIVFSFAYVASLYVLYANACPCSCALSLFDNFENINESSLRYALLLLIYNKVREFCK